MRPLVNTTRYLVVSLATLGLSFAAQAQDKAPTKAAPAAAEKKVPGQDKVDITDIEQKYWAPKDTDFSVVQNRTYSKEKRFSVSGQYGTLMNDPYSDSSTLGLRANYFFSERYGVEAFYYSLDPVDNDAISQLQSLTTGGAKPNHNKLSNFYGLGFNWVPFYAKMSFLGKHIIYFDMAFTPTLGMVGYDQQTEDGTLSKSTFTYGLDVTQYFFFSRHFAVRVDLSNRWHEEEVVKFKASGGQNTGDKVKDQNTNTTMLLLGVTLFF